MDLFGRTAENASGSSPSSPHDSICFSKMLGSYDVGQNFLTLTMDEAMKLVVDPGVLTRHKAYGMFSENIKVYDDLNNAYNMRVTVAGSYSNPEFCLRGDWDRFVLTREAKSGEVISFYKYIDEVHGKYYVMKISNRLASIQENDRAKGVKRGPDLGGSESASKKLRGLDSSGSGCM